MCLLIAVCSLQHSEGRNRKLPQSTFIGKQFQALIVFLQKHSTMFRVFYENSSRKMLIIPPFFSQNFFGIFHQRVQIYLLATLLKFSL
jgi:hypothetical protein